MLKLAKYLKNYKFQVIAGPAFKLIEAIFELIVPLVMARIVDIGIKNNDISYILFMGGIMIGLGLLGLGCAITCQYNAAKASQGFGTVLRNDLFKHIYSLSHAELDKIGAPSLVTRMTGDINQLQLAVAMLIRLVVRAPFLVIGSAIIALTIDFKLGIIFLITIPLVAVVLYFVMSRSVPLYKKVQSLLDKISLITRENLAGVRVIRAFSRQKSEAERFADSTGDLQKAAVRVGRLSALLSPITYIILNAAIIAIIWFGGIQVDTGALAQGELIALVQYMTQILLALVVVANLVVIFTKASASARRINEVFELQPSVVPGGGDVSENPSAPAIAFENVCFGYGGENTIDNISFSVERGQTIGIIGGTGSGKSTLVQLIARFYDAASGKILINGEEIQNYTFERLKKIVGIVPQKAVLFSGTIAKNLRMGAENATDAELYKALEIAQAAEFVNALNNKMEQKLLQGGKNLSGGQKQRLTIARALAANPEILILDDSFSALDFATDSALRKALAENTHATLIMVSQRVSAIRNADKIIVLDNGRLVGIGTHEELLKSCDIYSEICLSQQTAV